ncbi:unnamed protein product [Cercospora beticola]|nr:unnamed protein product [Cercospora beticola]
MNFLQYILGTALMASTCLCLAIPKPVCHVDCLGGPKKEIPTPENCDPNNREKPCK